MEQTKKNIKVGKDTFLSLKLGNGTVFRVSMSDPSNKQVVGQDGIPNCHNLVEETGKLLGFQGATEEPEKVKVLA